MYCELFPLFKPFSIKYFEQGMKQISQFSLFPQDHFYQKIQAAQSLCTIHELNLGICRNVEELLRVGLHWRVPFIEVLSETVQVVW